MPRSVGLDAAALVRFVDDNYTNPDMGLKLVAGEFGLTEEYVSTLFRSAAGKGFGDYLEGRRMGDARRRLATGRPSIQVVAEAVGYRSAHAFRRAFKRHFGYSPSEARHAKGTSIRPTSA
jgi:AraC-like DNA-binding protein